MDRWTRRAWAVTAALLAVAAVGVLALPATGLDPLAVAVGVALLASLSAVTWRSGGRFEFQATGGRPLGPRDPPEIRHAILAVCERSGRPLPTVLVVEMDAPGARVGYDDGDPVLAVDPRLPRTVGPAGLEAILAHELGHLGTDLGTDAVRKFLPQTIGFCVCWVVVLSRLPAVLAAGGGILYLSLVFAGDQRLAPGRYLLSLGTEPAALAVSRYASRLEEYAADEYAADLVDPATLSTALFRIAAVATGDNDEDVAGPVPWRADRSPWFALFATHPAIEDRVRVLGCSIPEWVRPGEPHRTASDGVSGD